MKIAKLFNKISTVLRVIGVVLICLGIVLWLYNLANTGGAWNSLSGGLRSAGVETGAVDRLAFDRSYFTALSQSVGKAGQDPQARRDAIRPLFSRWFDKLDAVQAAADEETQRAAVAWLNDEVDAEAFLERLESVEEMQESQELREIFEYVNSLMPAPKGKAAKLKPASQEPFFAEYYAAFAEENGEEAGTWFEFMTTVRLMLEEAVSNGTAIKDVKAWMNDSFDPEAYFELLPQVQSAERSEMGDNLISELGAITKGHSVEVWSYGTCKNPQSQRTINIGDTLVKALKDYKKLPSLLTSMLKQRHLL